MIRTFSVALLCLAGLIIASSSGAKIISSEKLADIERVIAEADSETLLIFDCDGVIWESAARAFQGDEKRVTKAFMKKYLATLSVAAEEKILRYLWEKVPKQLLEEKMPALIAVAQSRGIKTLMLTGAGVGRIGTTSRETRTIQHLLHHGISFGNSWNLGKMTFDHLLSFHRGAVSAATFSSGILFSITQDKGVVLRAFLEKIPSYKFKKIIFIDDKMKHLKSVETVADEIGAEFVGIEYTIAKKKKRTPADLTKIKRELVNFLKTASSIGRSVSEEISLDGTISASP
ncbi:MAG: DUF2608 domain-containing protein [Holosporaceae bacterium]|jgi:hypothetical protein|nr:DUF2608 domain-containing protein [Holosporaceae bacterium]